MIKTIVIDDNNSVINSLKKHFLNDDKVKIVGTFNNGENALNYIINNANEIDLILMDILIPGLDGISLLEELKSRKIKKKIIILSNYKDEEVIKECSNYNVNYYMLKPFSIIALERRIKELFSFRSKPTRHSDNIDIEISQLLHNIGIPSHIRGYKYIKDGVLIIYNNDSVSLITKDIYPTIANKYETTPSRVERAIRHAIEVSWLRGDLTLMEDLFGFSVSCDKSKPTNAEFLATIAERIKNESIIN